MDFTTSFLAGYFSYAALFTAFLVGMARVGNHWRFPDSTFLEGFLVLVAPLFTTAYILLRVVAAWVFGAGICKARPHMHVLDTGETYASGNPVFALHDPGARHSFKSAFDNALVVITTPVLGTLGAVLVATTSVLGDGALSGAAASVLFCGGLMTAFDDGDRAAVRAALLPAALLAVSALAGYGSFLAYQAA